MVICKGSLHHIPNVGEALKEIRRALKPGGVLVLSEPCRDNRFWRAIDLAYIKRSRHFSEVHSPFRSKDLEALLSANGFTIRATRPFGFLAFPLCGLAYLFPLMRYMPFNTVLTRWLIRFDELILKIPLVRDFRWHLVVYANRV